MAVVRFVWNLILAVLLIALIALVLGTAFGLVAARAWETDGLDDGRAESTWLWIDGQPIYYQALGDEEGPCVVLVHGHAPEGSETWTRNTSALVRSGLRVISVDLRGYGRSQRSDEQVYSVRQQADLLASVLNNLQVSDAIVIGHDLGSAVALQMALDQPQFVGRLVLIAPRLERQEDPLWEWALKIPYVRRAALWARWGGGPLLGLERKSAFADQTQVTNDYLRSVRAYTHIEGSIAAVEAMVLTPADSDLPEALEGLDVPVLVLLGSDDRVVTGEQVDAWVGRMPAADVETISDAGHYPHYEQSGVVNQRLLVLAAEARNP